MSTTQVTTPAPTGPNRGNRFWQWLWRGQEIRRVVAQVDGEQVRLQRLKRARIAAEAGDGALAPVDPVAFASTVPLALSCYREAAYWALLAQEPSLEAPDLAAAIERSAPPLVSFAAGGERGLARLRAAFVSKTFVDLAALRESELAEVARQAQVFVHALLTVRSAPEKELHKLRRQRRRRMLLSVVLLLAATITGLVVYKRATTAPDLALGKPWRASSKMAECRPELERCAGVRTKIFFLTNVEENPWYEVDLGRPQAVSVVDIDNRIDCCIDRARGLIVELSTDGRTWTTVARQPQSFHFWIARFPTRQARYVRLSVPKKTSLHLQRVAVRER